MSYTKKQLTPVRSGRTYCAPFCGSGCTWEDHQAAQKAAKALATRLGKGWTPRVWENMGWHYSVVSPSGAIKVHAPGAYGQHLAFFGPGSAGGRWVGRHTNPATAVAAAIRKAHAAADEILALLAAEERAK